MSEPLEVHDPATLINQFIALTTVETTQIDGVNQGSEFTAILAELISEGKLTLLEFIQLLGPTLTSDNDAIRSKAVNCLSSTLITLKQNDTFNLSMKDINVLIDFLLSKFDDKPSLQYSLQLIDSLVLSKNFKPTANDNLQRILKLLKEQYTPRSHLARIRYLAFKILQTLLLSHTDYISINQYALFTEAFVHIATGEKDPRNLLLSFELNASINKSFTQLQDESKLVEELFDVCFCYFPITFTPPPNDPYGITSEQLKTSLRNAVASQSLYAKDLFPSLFEKLTSTNPTIRNDVLTALLSCVETYSEETIIQHWLSIWNAVKFEILHNEVTAQLKPNEDYLIPPSYNSQYPDDSEEKTLILVLDLFTRILKKFENNDDALKSYLDIVIAELSPKLKGLKEKTYKHSVIILSVLASCNEDSFYKISKFLFSTEVWGKYIDNESESIEENELLNTSRQRDLIDSFGYAFIAYDILAHNTKLDENFTQTNSLYTHKDHLLIFMGQLLQTSSVLEKTLKCKLIQQLTKLIRLPDYLSAQEDLLVVTYFNDNLINTIEQEESSWDTDIVLREIVLNMRKLSGNDTIISMFVETCLPNLLNYVTTDFPSYPKILNLLSELVFNYRMLETLSIRLLGRLSDASTFEDNQFGKLVIDTLVKLIINAPESILKVNFESWYKNFIPRFLTIVHRNIENMDYGTIEASGELVGLVVRLTHKLKHNFIFEDFMTKYNGTSFESANKTIIITNRVLSNIDKTVTCSLDFSAIVEILQSDDFKDEYLRLSYLQTLAIIVNKFTPAVDEGYLSSLYDNLTLVKQVEIFAWILKGLVIKLNALGTKFLAELTTKLGDAPPLSDAVAKAFNIIYIDLPNFTQFQFPNYSNGSGPINDVRNLNVRPLYKQFTFEQILPKLIEGYTTTRKTTYLVAMALILNNLTSSIYQSHLKQILPLILNSLVLDNPMLIKASLMTLEVIIDEDSLVKEHLDTIIPRLISLASVQSKQSGETRKLSLKCLYNLFHGFEPRDKLFKYKQETLKELVPVLDDRKRHIRKLACDIRQVLYEMDV